MPKLVPEMTYYADLTAPDPVGPGPFGNRLIVNVTGGEVSGERLKGTFVGAGADWLIFGEDGFGRLDVRATVLTHDGAYIYLQYTGLLEATPGMMEVLAGGQTPTQYGDQYFFTNPRLETGDERYAWVNTTMFLSQGRLVPGPRVEYQVFRVEND